MLLIYEDESIYGPGKNGPAMQQIVRIAGVSFRRPFMLNGAPNGCG